MKRPAAASNGAAKKAKTLPEGDDPKEVRAQLFKAGSLFAPEDYDGPQKWTLVAPGYGKFKNAKPLELHYFAIRALGQLQQLCCEIAGHPYIYHVMLVKHFQENMKADLEFGRLPMVRTADKKELVQSKAVLRYVAAHVGLAGKTVSDIARCDMWYEMLQSEGALDGALLTKLSEMETLPELNGDLKWISRKDTMELSEEQKAGNALKFWDVELGKSKSGFIMPFITFVDVALWWALRTHVGLIEKASCANLKAFVEKMSKLPGLARMVDGMRIMPDMAPGYKYQEDEYAKKPEP